MSYFKTGDTIIRPAGKNTRSAFLCDLHGEHVDPDALRWAIKEAVHFKPQVLLLGGDVGDFTAVSRFPKSPEQAMGHEAEMAHNKKMLKRIDVAFKRCLVVLFLGNHEDRVKKYIWKGAPALANTPELNVAAMMGVPRRWRVVPYKHHLIDQDVLVQHGTRWGANTCRANMADFGMSNIQGHSHRTSTVTRKLPNDRVIQAVESGCLCKLKAGYAPLNNWSHAMTIIHNGKMEVLER